ncbi:MAG: DUF2652 domain-containing protein [Bacteroidia bacterium]
MSASSDEEQALICIPDITGFTRFMAENDIEFSRKIIPPLLRNIVGTNTLGLKVGEVEGDAVLFYRFGALPPLSELIEQCKNFYFNFNEQLESLQNEFADDFHKNVSSNRLCLKIIVHAAEMTSTFIEGITKLIGEDVVVVHKLLKNSIKDPEYILVSEKLLANYTKEEISSVFNWAELEQGQDEYEFIGTIKYRYISFEPLIKKAIEKPKK